MKEYSHANGDTISNTTHKLDNFRTSPRTDSPAMTRTAVTSSYYRRIKSTALAFFLASAAASARAFSFPTPRRSTSSRVVAAAANYFGGASFGSNSYSASSRSFRTTFSTYSNSPSASVIASTRGGGGIYKKSIFARHFSSSSSVVLEAEESTMDLVKASAARIPAGEKLAAMRAKMEENGVDVYIVPSDDPHLSEYVPAAYMRRGFLTDFHGSAGTALVTKDNAYLWTDSRYFNEASLRLDSTHWELMKQGQPKVPTIPKFLSELATTHYKESKTPLRVGMDAYVHSASFAKELNEVFEGASRDIMEDSGSTATNGDHAAETTTPVIAVIDTLDGKPNVVDSIWEDRPPLPKNAFRVQPMEYAGVSVEDKVVKIRSEMTEKKATMTVFGALDDVAYLFNVRCMGDIETCPIGIAYATITHDQVTLYCDEEKVTPKAVAEHLKSANVQVKPYGDIVQDIQSHLDSNSRNKVWVDNSRSNYAISRVIPASSLIDAQNAVVPMKGVKNPAEMEGMRRAHIVDGAAMAHFMAWLEQTIVVEGRAVSEVEIDLVLTGYRAQQPGFYEVSFPTIAGVGANGAIVHYRAAEGSELLKYLDTTQPILIDSGGQYGYGTTDVTRTWHLGEPTEEFSEMYTRVLKGNIGLDTMIFPENTPGFVLDVFARKALWEIGKDYGHGTGHGVGAGLNVHEGPHGISPRWTNKEVLKEGMVTSNEPGFYDDGNYGIRIENLLEIVDVSASDDANGEERPNKKQKVDSKKFLKFAKLTMIPIQKNLINIGLMSDSELNWLDTYHEEVFQKVSPLLEEGSPAMKWLVKSCEKIDRQSK